MIDSASSQSSDARCANIWRGAARFRLPLVLAALFGALAPATLAGASLGTHAITAGSAAGSYSVVVTTTAAWSATANASFLHTSASGTGNGLAKFTVDAFTGTGTRTGTLTIAGLTLTVTQAGANYIAVNAVTTRLSAAADGVAVDSAGDIYMSIPWSGTEGNQLLELSVTTGVNTLVTSGEGLNNPGGLAVDGSGNVYIANRSYNTILEYIPAFLSISTLVASAQGLSGPTGLALDGSGNVYFADTGNSAVKEWSAGTLQVSTVASGGNGLSSPTGVALDASANIYIADTGNNAIKEWNSTTQDLTTLVSTGLSGPAGVAVDGSGNVYIADHGDNAIKEWVAATGTLTTLLSTGLSGPTDVAVDASGNVYIADYGNGAVKELPNGFVGPASLTESAAAGSDSVNVLPATQPLTGELAPSSDSGWLTVGTVSGGVVDFSFTANTSTARTGHITVLGMSIPVTQSGLQATVTNVTSTAANGTYGTAASIPITLTFNTAVTVTGTPQLALNSGGAAYYSSGSGTATLTFTYTVVAGQSSTHLDYTSTSALALNGGTIDDGAGNSAVLTLSTPGAAGSLSANTNIVIETDASQTITFGAIANQNYSSGATVPISATASSGLVVTFTSLTTSICTVSASTLSSGTSSATVTQVAAGQCAIQATQPGNAIYAAVTAADQTVLLFQPALGTTAILVGSAAGSSSVILAAASAWTAVSNSSFLHVASGSASGTGNAVVIFLIDAFTGTGTRTGTLTVDGLTLTVTQVGTDYIPVSPVTALASTGLDDPEYLAVDSSGNVYFADTQNNAIKKWNATTQQVTTPPQSSGLQLPTGVAVDGAGNVYVVDHSNSIFEWNTTNGLTALPNAYLSSLLDFPEDLALDSYGNLYTPNYNSSSLAEWNASTQTMIALVGNGAGLNKPYGVAVDAAGNVYIADTGDNTIKEWNSIAGTPSALPHVSGLGQPEGVAVDGSGNVFIGDNGNNAVKEWNASTQTMSTLVSTGLSGPMGVAVDGLGNIYIADAGNNAVKKITNAFVGPASFTESAAAGNDALLQVIPAATNLTGIFAPASDSSWLTIGSISNGVVSFSFTANTSTAARLAHIAILGMSIPVTQSGLPATVTNVSSTAANGTYGTSAVIPVTLTFNEPVTVTGTPQLTLNTGGVANYSSGSGTATLTFLYTVSAGQSTAQLDYTSAAALTLNGGTIVDGVGNGAALTLPAPGAAGSLSANKNIAIDTRVGQTITFNSLPNQIYGAAPFAISATASSGLLVSFTSETTSVCAVSTSTLSAGVSSATVTLLATGTCTIQATQSGDVSYLAATPVSQSFQAIPASLGTNAILVGSATGTSSVIVTAPGAWTATSNASWLHTTASGTGRGLAVFSIDAFTGAGTRSGTLSIAGFTLTVTQAGTNYVQVTGLTTLVPSTSGLNWPSDVAVDGAGNVFISDSRNGMIREWSATAQTVSTLVSAGLADAQGLAVDGAGNVFIADYGHSEIQEWNTANGLVPVVSSGLSSPYGVAVDGLGNIYIADSGDQAGKEWTASTGTLSTLVPSGMQLPWGAAVDSAGNAYFSDSNFSLIKKWNASTQTAATLVATNLNAPAGLAVDGSGNIYIANSDNSQIKEWNASTQSLTTLVSSGLSFAMGVAVDGSGNLYIADTFNNAIEELPHAFVGPVSMTESPAAGSGSLLQVVPATESLIGIFAPTSSDTSWLTIGTIANGVVSFNFTANTGASARTANITVLGVTVPVTQLAAQSITFGALSDVPYGTAPFAVSATASSGLAVGFDSLTASVCTVSSGMVTLVSVGTCTIEASQAGNTTYSAATPVDRSFQVTPGSQTISFGALSNQVYGTAPFTISASVSSGLAVSFTSQTTPVCTVSASTLSAGVSSATLTLVAAGTCTIEATQSGNANYSAATAVDRSFTVTLAQPGLTLNAPAVTYGVGASATVTLVTSLATTPTGTVTLAVDGGTAVVETLSGGAATFSLGVLAAGNHALSVTYSGDIDYQAITAAQAAVLLANPVLVVNKASTAVALAVSGQTATATVSVTPPGAGSPTGSVQFLRGSTVLGTVSLSGLTATLANATAGAVTAVYSGDGNFSSSTSPGQTVYVPTSSVFITSSANPSTLGQTVTFTAAVTNGDAPPSSTATGTVQFFDGTTALGTASLSNGQATYTTAAFGGGRRQIVAKYSGDGVFPPAQATYQQVVSAVTAVSLSVSPAAPSLGQPVTVTATVTSVTAAAGFAAPTGTVTFVLGGTAFMAGTPVGTVPLSSGTASFTFTGLLAGGNEITAEYSGDGTWSDSFLTIVVTVSGSSVTVGEAPSATSVNLAVVDGQLVLSAAVTPAAAGPGTPTGSVQFINTIDNSVVATATLSNGSASVSGVSNAAALPIEAAYSGDSNFQASTSTPLPAATNAAALLMANFAPAEIASLYGVAGLSGNATGTLPLPTVLGGTTVTITDSTGTARPAQLTAAFASASQINFVIPAGTANGFATVTITTPGGGTIETVILVGTTAPGIFTANMTGKGVYAGQVVDGNPDGTQTILSPAVWDAVTNQYDAAPISLGPAGEQVYLVLYGTGLRQATTVTASVNGVSLPVAYYGAQSQFPGLDQVNLEVPRSLAGAGLVNLVVTVDGAAANTVTFDIE